MKETVAFIICYDEERCLEECIYYISRLQVPRDLEVSVLSVLSSSGMASAYNEAMEESKAKYKVYLDQRTLIINDFFLYDLVSLFRKHPDAGIFGVLGSSNTGEMDRGRILVWSEEGLSQIDYQEGREAEEAEVVSGMLLAIRQDWKWREGGGLSCQEALCQDIKSAGYRILIPWQSKSWCIYDCRESLVYEGRTETESKIQTENGFQMEYQYLLQRVEVWHDIDSAKMIKTLLEEGKLSYAAHMEQVEKQAFAKVLTGYFWEDFLNIDRNESKYLPANGSLLLDSREKNQMHVAAAFNHGYAVYAAVMLQSLYENNPLCQIQVHILQSDLTYGDKVGLKRQAESFQNQIFFYDFDNSLLPDGLQVTKEWSKEAYFRLFMTELLPDTVDRILYLDVDMIIGKPIYNLYFMEMQGKDIIGCRDFSQILRTEFADMRKELFAPLAKEKEFVYFNSGMMLMDLAGLRQWIRGADYLQVAEDLKGKLLAPDQDILNLVHWQKTGLVDEFRYDIFNACLKDLKAEELELFASIIHYAGPKPWMPIDISKHAHRLWWDYASRTRMASGLLYRKILLS
ncbi:MAG: hypothetical protein IKM28_07310 [Lachnospiraceae bacterium]|nr:hypothetical protein [Lachnospiraceae bacterium]